MAQLVSSLLFLVYLTTSCLGQSADVTIPDGNDVAVTEGVSVMKDGQEIHSTRYVAKDCSQQYTKTDFADDTSSTVIDDLNDEISVILLSTSPDYCFVRDITGARRKCVEGSVKIQEGEESDSADTQYAWGAELNLADLPEGLRDICEGRTVVQVTAVGAQDSGDGASSDSSNQVDDVNGQSRRRIDSKIITCTTTKKNCHKCTCVGWLFRKRTCQTCCDEEETCKTIGR